MSSESADASNDAKFASQTSTPYTSSLDAPDHHLLFSSVSDAFLSKVDTAIPAEVVGRLPSWLHGTLFRNGPGTFEYGQKHLFDGYSLLQRYELNGVTNTASFTAKMLESGALKEAKAAGWMVRREFGSDGFTNIFSRTWSLFKQSSPVTDNASVNIVPMGGRLVALSEVPTGYVISSTDLATLGPFDSITGLEGSDAAVVPTAHPLHHHRLRATINIMTRIRKGTTHAYDVVLVPDDIPVATEGSPELSSAAMWNASVAAAVKTIRMPISAPSYHHSFSITDKYVIIHDSPMRYGLSSLLWTLTTGAPVTDFFPWDAAQPSLFHVISIEEKTCKASIPGPPFMTFHHINAYETLNDKGEEEIVMDVCAYKDSSFIKDLTVQTLQMHDKPFLNGGQFRRMHINLASSTCTEDDRYASTPLATLFHELPRINEAFIGRKYRFAWAARVVSSFNGIVKMDVDEGEVVATWERDGCHPGEPVFVPRPCDGAPQEEDDGVIVSVVLDAVRKHSALAVLDAATLQQLAWVPLPGAMPLSFHGSFSVAT